MDVGQQEVVDQDEELVGVCPFPAERRAAFAILTHEVVLGEAQGEVDGREAGAGLAGLPPCSDVPPGELDGEVQQHGRGQDEGEAGQDGDGYEPSAMVVRERAEVVTRGVHVERSCSPSCSCAGAAQQTPVPFIPTD